MDITKTGKMMTKETKNSFLRCIKKYLFNEFDENELSEIERQFEEKNKKSSDEFSIHEFMQITQKKRKRAEASALRYNNNRSADNKLTLIRDMREFLGTAAYYPEIKEYEELELFCYSIVTATNSMTLEKFDPEKGSVFTYIYLTVITNFNYMFQDECRYGAEAYVRSKADANFSHKVTEFYEKICNEKEWNIESAYKNDEKVDYIFNRWNAENHKRTFDKIVELRSMILEEQLRKRKYKDGDGDEHEDEDDFAADFSMMLSEKKPDHISAIKTACSKLNTLDSKADIKYAGIRIYYTYIENEMKSLSWQKQNRRKNPKTKEYNDIFSLKDKTGIDISMFNKQSYEWLYIEFPELFKKETLDIIAQMITENVKFPNIGDVFQKHFDEQKSLSLISPSSTKNVIEFFQNEILRSMDIGDL